MWKDNIDKDAELFKDVQWLVEATSAERFFLWKENDRSDPLYRVYWREVSMGKLITIGHLDNRPICVSISYAFLNGVKVMFYYGTSQVVDHKMVEEWRRHHTSHLKHDGGRPNHCDAMNMGHCLQYVTSKKGLGEG